MALLAPALKGDASGMWRGAQGFMNYGRTGREELRRAIEYHQLCCATCCAPATAPGASR